MKAFHECFFKYIHATIIDENPIQQNIKNAGGIINEPNAIVMPRLFSRAHLIKIYQTGSRTKNNKHIIK